MKLHIEIDRVSSAGIWVRVSPWFLGGPGAADQDDVSSSQWIDLGIPPGDTTNNGRTGLWATVDGLREGTETFQIQLGNVLYYWESGFPRAGGDPLRGRETAIVTIHDGDCIRVADREEGDATGEVVLWARTTGEEDYRMVDAGDVIRVSELLSPSVQFEARFSKPFCPARPVTPGPGAIDIRLVRGTASVTSDAYVSGWDYLFQGTLLRADSALLRASPGMCKSEMTVSTSETRLSRPGSGGLIRGSSRPTTRSTSTFPSSSWTTTPPRSPSRTPPAMRANCSNST